MPARAVQVVVVVVLLGLGFAQGLGQPPPQAPPAKPPASQPAGAGLGQDAVVVDEKTDAAIKGALKYLASMQKPNGAWSANKSDNQHLVAMTGYVLIALMSTGNLPDEGEYGKNVTAGMQFLVNSVKPDGFIQSGETNMYGHGVAAIALAELYGQTKDTRLKPKVELAIKLIINCQNDKGGWRYQPRVADGDISISVLQVVALRAAKNAGLDVPQKTIDKAVEFVRSCYDQRSGGFSYTPQQREPGFARTAAAIYSLQVCGQYDDQRIATGSAYLLKTRADRQWFTYGAFYAAPAQYMIGGRTWAEWYASMNTQLMKGIKRQGELAWWESDLDQGMRLGPVYNTAVYVSILAMPYHYLPLYQR